MDDEVESQDKSTRSFNVLAIEKRGSQTVLYDGDELDGSGLEEYLGGGKVQPGYFTSIEYVARAIDKAIELHIKTLEDFEKEDTDVQFFSDQTLSYGWSKSRAFILEDGIYIPRPLNESELNSLIRLVDEKIRPRLWPD